MRDIVEYWAPGEGPENDPPLGVFNTVHLPEYPELAAKEVCAMLWSRHDGWEWMEESQEVMIMRIGGEKGTIHKFTFDVDFDPHFYIGIRKGDDDE